jgi:hypothetical protein
LELPTIALELEELLTWQIEMGSRAFGKTRTWYIDIFAENKAQRDEYAFRILYALEQKIPVYDYDQGFVSPAKVGVLDPDDVQIRIIKVLPEMSELMYYRSVVQFTAVYEAI